MQYSVGNSKITITADTFGAQLHSIKSNDGVEYVWVGDPAYWGKHAPVLFPFIARLDGAKYEVYGKTYEMTSHGFASKTEFELKEKTESSLAFVLKSAPTIKERYPFDFEYEVKYELEGSAVKVINTVRNFGDKAMHFAVGGHPGFNVPINGEGQFEDWYLEFEAPCEAMQVGFTSDTILVNGEDVPYPLEKGKILRLQHDLFDVDAVVLRDTAKRVTLKSDKSDREVEVYFPDMPYVGFWHCPKKAAPYVCVEPWSTLPGRSGVLEDIEKREDFNHLPTGETYVNEWTITVK